MLVVREHPVINHVLELPVRLSQQALDRNRCFQAAILQRFEHASDDPPELVHIIAGGRMLKRRGNVAERFEMSPIVATLDPAQQRKLEFGPQPLRDNDRVLPTALPIRDCFSGTAR